MIVGYRDTPPVLLVSALLVVFVDTDPLRAVAVSVVIVVGGRQLLEELRTSDEPADELAHAHSGYVNGDYDEKELERRVARAIDPENPRIRESVTPIHRVGDDTADALYAHFGTLESVESATPDELEDVHGVGPSTAEKIHERLN